MDLLLSLYIREFRHLRNVLVNFGTGVGLRRSLTGLEVVDQLRASELGYPPQLLSIGALIGSNGAGKTTILDLLARVLGQPDQAPLIVRVPGWMRGRRTARCV